MKLCKLSFILFFSLSSVTGFSQRNDDKLNRILNEAEMYIKDKKYDKADKYLRYSINKVDKKDVLWDKLAQVSVSQKKYDAAVEYYRMAMNFKPENKSKYELLLTKYLILSEQFLEAEYILNHIVPQYNWTEGKVHEYNKYKAFFSDKNMIYSNMYKEVHVVNVGDAINSSMHEYFPSMSHDDSTMIFTRKFNGIEEDFFIVHKDPCNEQWYSAEHMGYPPNSNKNEGAQCLSYDRNYIYLMRCENEAISSREAGGCDLYFSYTKKGEWIAPVPFGATINTNYFEGMPSFSADNKILYFVSDRPGGYGGKDIWKTEYTKDGWSVPVNLGPNVNTDKDEISPFIAADNKSLYFSSKGHIGFGGFDIFKSELNTSTGEFSHPINLGLPYNSAHDDMSWFLLANGQKAYFASDRPGGWGGMDIYTVNVLKKYQPQPTTFIAGHVIDSLSHEYLTNTVIDVYNQADEKVAQMMSNPGDGSFFVSLPPHHRYKFVARRYDYPEREMFIETDVVAHHPPIELNIYLLNWMDKRNIEAAAQQSKIDSDHQNVSELDPETLGNYNENGEIEVQLPQ